MRLDRPLAKFRLKSDSNLRWINFFNPNFWSLIASSRQIQLYIVWFISNIDWIWSKVVKNNWIFNQLWHFWLNSTFFDRIIDIDMIIFDLLIKKMNKNTSKLIDYNQNLIKIWSKSQSSIQSRSWNPNWTKIDNQICIRNANRRGRLDWEGLITVA